MSDMWNRDESLEMEYRQPICQNNDQSISGKKEIEKQPYGKKLEGQGRITNQVDSL